MAEPGLVDNTGPGCGVPRCRGEGETGSVENTGSRPPGSVEFCREK